MGGRTEEKEGKEKGKTDEGNIGENGKREER